MRKELYRLLCSELKAIDLIKHIDLWNHNVEFIEQEEMVPMTAFIYEIFDSRHFLHKITLIFH